MTFITLHRKCVYSGWQTILIDPGLVLIRLDRGTEGIRAHNLWETITPGHVVHLIVIVRSFRLELKQQGQTEKLPRMRTHGLSQPVPLEKNHLHLKRACQRETAKAPERARAGTPWVLAPLQCEWTHAWLTHWQAQWKDSQSQSADGGYSGLVTWDIEEIQRNNLSMPNTLSQRRTGRRCSRIHSKYEHPHVHSERNHINYIYIHIYIYNYISHIYTYMWCWYVSNAEVHLQLDLSLTQKISLKSSSK